MAQEFKIRIHNYEEIEKLLVAAGATFVSETDFIDTYFNAPQGTVLKIVQNDISASLVRFVAKDGKFDVVGKEAVTDVESTIEKLTKEHGIHKVLKGTRKEYLFKEFAITFNLIDEVGEFLIVISESGQEQFIEEVLQIQNPEVITVPFSEL